MNYKCTKCKLSLAPKTKKVIRLICPNCQTVTKASTLQIDEIRYRNASLPKPKPKHCKTTVSKIENGYRYQLPSSEFNLTTLVYIWLFAVCGISTIFSEFWLFALPTLFSAFKIIQSLFAKSSVEVTDDFIRFKKSYGLWTRSKKKATDELLMVDKYRIPKSNYNSLITKHNKSEIEVAIGFFFGQKKPILFGKKLSTEEYDWLLYELIHTMNNKKQPDFQLVEATL